MKDPMTDPMTGHSHHPSHEHDDGIPTSDTVPVIGSQQMPGDQPTTTPATAGHTGHHVQSAATAHGTHESGTHVDHTGHEKRFRNRFWICLILSVPVLLYSEMLQMWLGFQPPAFPGSTLVAPLFATVIFLIGGIPFLQMARPELRMRQPGMMTLISLAITVAFVYSVAMIWINPTSDFFWEMALLIDVMLLGHWLEMRSVRQASGALNELAKLMPDTADKIQEDGATQTVPAASLTVGDVVLVRPGAGIPADGEVIGGESDVVEAMITGESKPVRKSPGAQVIAGAVNGAGSLRVRVTATGEATALSGIMRLVAEAQNSKSRTQLLADRAARILFYVALAVAGLTALGWTILTGFGMATVERVVTVLVIACPHALGLAVPLVVAISTSLAARNGILVRNRLALEEARQVNTVIFDKTGTLTTGKQGLVAWASEPADDSDALLALAAAAEGDSEHIIGRAIRDAARDRKLALPQVAGFAALQGRGVQVQMDGKAVYMGGPRLLEMLQLTLPASLAEFSKAAGERGETVVYLVVDRNVRSAFAVADVVRPESKEAVNELHASGVQVAMLTGDSEAVASAVARELGIDTYFAEVLPEHKDAKVAQLQQGGKIVAMVGDGVNDAPALARANVGIAIGAGTDVAIESAGIILAESDPRAVVSTITLSHATYRKMVENLWWAAGYNIVALPLAAGVLAPWGIELSPAVGALLMSLSTIIVAFNAQLLRRTPLRRA